MNKRQKSLKKYGIDLDPSQPPALIREKSLKLRELKKAASVRKKQNDSIKKLEVSNNNKAAFDKKAMSVKSMYHTRKREIGRAKLLSFHPGLSDEGEEVYAIDDIIKKMRTLESKQSELFRKESMMFSSCNKMESGFMSSNNIGK